MKAKVKNLVPSPEEISGNGKKEISEEQKLKERRREFIFSGLGKDRVEKVKREDIVALDHVLEQIDPYIFCLQNYKEIVGKEVKMDTGILLYGYGGVGKTLIAKYMVAASGAHFVNVADLPKEKSYLLPNDIRELFRLSREYVKENNRPILLFWDEFSGISSDVVAQLKIELDGIDGKPDGVLLVASSNSWPEKFDDALMRAGRLGTHVYVPLQKKEGRRALLEHYASKKKLEDDMDFESLSYITKEAMAPSDIEDMVEKAWRDAHIRNIKNEGVKGSAEVSLTQDDLAKVLLRKFLGTQEDVALSEEESMRIAVYEIGRAIVARSLGQPTQAICVPKFGKDRGVRIAEFELKSGTPVAMYAAQISVRWGGSIAHKMCDIPPNDYSLEDSESIKKIAEQIVVDFHSDFSTISVRRSGASSVVAGDMDSLIAQQKELAEKILNAYSAEELLQHAKELVAREYMLQTDIDKIVKAFELDMEKHIEENSGLYL